MESCQKMNWALQLRSQFLTDKQEARTVYWLDVGIQGSSRSEGSGALLNSNFDGWETNEADGVTLDPDGKKHKCPLEANAKAMHLLGASVKGVTCQNIINKEKQADPKFLTGNAHRVIKELDNRFSPNDWMAGTETLTKLNKIRLKNSNENPLQMIEQLKNWRIQNQAKARSSQKKWLWITFLMSPELSIQRCCLDWMTQPRKLILWWIIKN